MSQPPPFSRPIASRLRLCVERLEDRTLLSVGRGSSGIVPFSSLTADRSAADSSSILVRFRPGLNDLSGAHFLPGTNIGPELGLVPGLRSVQLNGVTVSAALAAYRASPWVAYAEPNWTMRAASTIPDDPQFSQQWALLNTGQTGGRPDAHINAPPAWDYGVGSTGQLVAVIDTGIDYNHPDLYLNVWINQQEIPASRRNNLFDLDGDGLITFWDLNNPLNQGPYQITDQNGDGRISAADILAPMALDGNGFDLGSGGWANGYSEYGGDRADDLVGWNFANNNNMPLDTNGHGTHVAGIIGAVGNNGIGVSGVNWRVQLMALKIGEGLGLNLAAAVSAMAYAVANGAFVSNHSYASADAPQALYDAIASARDAGHIVVAAAGNDGSNNDLTPVYPANFELENVIAVAATDHADQRAGFSNYGLTTVHLGAPGVNILSTARGGGYESRSGTSMAAAYVTGAAAYLHNQVPMLSYREIIDLILGSAEPIAALAGRTVTGARLSLSRATELALTPVNEDGGAGFGPDPGQGGGEDPLDPAQEDAIAVSLFLNAGVATAAETRALGIEQESAEASFVGEASSGFDMLTLADSSGTDFAPGLPEGAAAEAGNALFEWETLPAY